MAAWITGNVANIIIVAVLAGCVLLAIRYQIRSRKSGGCGCGCAGCAQAGQCGHCSSEGEKQRNPDS